jgi:hypothetical protein
MALSVAELGTESFKSAAGGGPPGLFDTTRQIFGHLVEPPPPKPPEPVRKATPVFAAKEEPSAVGHDGVPGVILRPDPKKRQEAVVLHAASVRGFAMGEPVHIPFTGEYHLFLAASGRLPANSVLKEGSPKDALYGTMNGGDMLMEAYQPFDVPVDFTNCGRLQLTIAVGDNLPAGVSVQLVTAGGMEDIGTEFYGLESKSEQVVEFRVPAQAPQRVIGIRVLFHSLDTTHSTKAAIKQFTMLPRLE